MSVDVTMRRCMCVGHCGYVTMCETVCGRYVQTMCICMAFCVCRCNYALIHVCR